MDNIAIMEECFMLCGERHILLWSQTWHFRQGKQVMWPIMQTSCWHCVTAFKSQDTQRIEQSNLSNRPLNVSLFPKMIQSSNQSLQMLTVKSPVFSTCAHSHAVIFLTLASVIITSVSWFTRTDKFSHVEPAQVRWLNNIGWLDLPAAHKCSSLNDKLVPLQLRVSPTSHHTPLNLFLGTNNLLQHELQSHSRPETHVRHPVNHGDLQMKPKISISFMLWWCI